MKNTLVIFLISILVIGGGLFVFVGGSKTNGNTNTLPDANSGDTQKITLSEKNFNYYPETVTVKAGQPVEITLDSNVKGCLRSLAIPQLGVSKYLRSAADKLLFTPPKQGTFTIQCSMGMGFGKLIVQ